MALSLASSTLARPQAGGYERQTTSSTTGGYGSPTRSTSSVYGDTTGGARVPPECMMFGAYVPPAFLAAVCSLHMTPLAAGVMPSIPTGCLVPTAGQNSLLYGNGPVQKELQPTTTRSSVTQLGGGYNQPSTTSFTSLDGYEQATTSSTSTSATTTASYTGEEEETEE
ncbi:MAG: hypothetical protein Q9200_002694 [Gallowayella weberi]